MTQPFQRLIAAVRLLAGPALLLALAACASEGHYPVSGEECGPNDPVLDLDASDCLPPTASGI